MAKDFGIAVDCLNRSVESRFLMLKRPFFCPGRPPPLSHYALASVIVGVAMVTHVSAITVPLCNTKGLLGIMQRLFLALGSLDGEEYFILFGNLKVSKLQ